MVTAAKFAFGSLCLLSCGVSYASRRPHIAEDPTGSRAIIEQLVLDASARLDVLVKIESRRDGPELVSAQLSRTASPPCSRQLLPSELEQIDPRRYRLRFSVLHQKFMGTELNEPTSLDFKLRDAEGERCMRVPFGADDPELTWRIDRRWFAGAGAGAEGFLNDDVGLNARGDIRAHFGRFLDPTWLWLEAGIGVAGRVGERIQPGEEDLAQNERTPAVPLPFAVVGNHPLWCAGTLCLRGELGYEANWIVLDGLPNGFVLHGPRTGLSLSLAQTTPWAGFDDSRSISGQLELPIKLLFDNSAGTTRAAVAVGLFVSTQAGF